MEIRDFAELVLHANNLADKLIVPDAFTDESPHHQRPLPTTPGRPANLSFARASDKAPFPKRLVADSDRGLMMHFFANHELMALELMALALLKLVDAPQAFRLGIADTMLEEQRHFLLYKVRAEQLGVGFGDVGLNSFFWDALSPMSSALDYVTQVSLTFEQANLDYAIHYRDRFEQVDDPRSAAIMGEIYRDEVKHVAFGVQWFNSWRPHKRDAWSEYRDSLPERLSPSWAKGLTFVEQGRREAGIDESFIRHLRVYSRSKGRPPRVFSFNPCLDDEEQLRELGTDDHDRARAASRDLAPLLMLLAGRPDIVLARPPSLPFLEQLSTLDLRLPEVLDDGEPELELEIRKHVLAVIVWQYDDDSGALLAKLRKLLLTECDHDARRTAQQRAQQLAAAAAEEPVAQVELELTFHADVGSPHKPQMLRVLRGPQGALEGFLLGKPWHSVDRELVRQLYSPQQDGSPLEQMAGRCEDMQLQLEQVGYRGALALHFGIGRSADRLQWRLERATPRLHMGVVALELARLLPRGQLGLWAHLGPQHARRAGHDNLRAYCKELQARSPLQTKQTPGRKYLSGGVLPTNDPAQCSERLTLLVADPDLAAELMGL